MTSGVEAAAVPGDATSNEQVQQGHHLENVDHAQPAELANEAPQQEISFSTPETAQEGQEQATAEARPSTALPPRPSTQGAGGKQLDSQDAPAWHRHDDVYAAAKRLFDKRKRHSDHCICALHYNNQVEEVAEELGLNDDPDLLDRLLSLVSSNLNCVSLEEMNVVLCLLMSESPTSTYLRSHQAVGQAPAQLAVGFLNSRVHLSRAQYRYLRSGSVAGSAQIVTDYCARLEAHRRKCQLARRYSEAEAAKERLWQLRTQQAELVRSQVQQRHEAEQEFVRTSMLNMRKKHQETCAKRVEELEERVIAAVDCLKQKHSAQEEELEGAEIPGSRRAHVRASSLHYRRVEDALGHLQRYKEAQVIKDKAFFSMCEDLTKGKEQLEGWQKFRKDQLNARQKREVEALLQRSCLQRDELDRELKRALELHDKRCNAVAAELDRLHGRELAHLEMFVGNKAWAGKCSEYHDAGFRRTPCLTQIPP